MPGNIRPVNPPTRRNKEPLAARLRRRLALLLFGVDPRSEVDRLRGELAAVHIALADAMVDLSDETRDAMQVHLQRSVRDVLRRSDLIIERVDRKAESLYAALSRRLDLPGEAEQASGGQVADSLLSARGDADSPFTDDVYLLFEQEFRGSEEETREKLKGYAEFFASGPVIDIGCGRGEMVELLNDQGLDAYGIDSNFAMVELCRAKSLKVFQADLFEHLEGLEPNSMGGIIANQVVEHLPPKRVLDLLRTAGTVLREGGRLVLETPNPTSLFALAQNWVRDPTHVWLVHPDTLGFMASVAGLDVVEVRFGSPVPPEYRLNPVDLDAEKLYAFVFGPQDYALFAEKRTREDRLG